MDVSAEAKRIMVVALGKLYSSRTQRGGLRLHRSLLLTLVMKSARDIYHAAQAEQQPAEPTPCPATLQPPRETVGESADHGDSRQQTLLGGGDTGLGGRGNKENRGPAPSLLHRHSRKRRGKAAAEPDFLPCKKAKMEGKGLQQLVLNSVLRNSVNCGGMVGARPNPVPVSCAIVAF